MARQFLKRLWLSAVQRVEERFVAAGLYLAGLRMLPDVGVRKRLPFDAVGLVLGGGGLSVAVLGLSEANT